ncbi:Anaerobic nitric oxide reductase transcription regulator NorR [Candidatus Entotheonellaceae bacterium PAL068K]
MTHNAQNVTPHWLVPIAPEILVSVSPHEPPCIAAVAPRVAAWTGRSPESLIGRPLLEVFDPIIPGLIVVLEDVCTSGTPVRDYRLSFEDVAGVEHTVLVQASMRPDTSARGQQMVALRLEEVMAAAQDVEPTASEVTSYHGMVGRSLALRKVWQKIDVYGPTEAPVLITGETGTGKELAARALHASSRRRQQPFVAVNCAALSAELLDSELFGHEKGAFTGAIKAHKGRFERAHTGTLFLDEIGEMAMPVQAKLLRVLEGGQVERVGSERAIRVDIRLVTATNVPLERAIQAKTFRLDLYHRLEVLRLHLPPLRERCDDIPMLVAYFLQQYNDTYQRQVRRLTAEAIALLQDYNWPGNLRELRNVLERVYVETATEVISRSAFDEWVEEREQFVPGLWDLEARRMALATRPTFITPYHDNTSPLPPVLPPSPAAPAPIEVAPLRAVFPLGAERSETTPVWVAAAHGSQELTRERMAAAFQQAGGNMTQAARYLGVHKATLYRRLKALGLTREDLESLEHAACGMRRVE